MNDELYLNDDQYLGVLKKIEATIAQSDFKPTCFDSTFPGDKYTESNCGFCCDELTDEETAMWPDQFPGRKTMKYRQESQKCPLDMRTEPGLLGWGRGCFYECYLFHNRQYDIQLMQQMVADLIKEVK